MRDVRLSKRIEFAAAHRYWREDWDAKRNLAVFGPSAREHGHNYMLEVTVIGPVDAKTGMVVNLYDLKRVLKELLEEFDHKHLNQDTPYFKQGLPTTEHIAGVLWGLLSRRREIGRLDRVRLYDDEDGCVDVTAPDMANGETFPASAGVVRRYALPEDLGTDIALSELYVTVHGPLDPERGQVIDPQALDHAVREGVLLLLPKGPRGGRHKPITGEQLAEDVWGRLTKVLPVGTLRHIRLVHSPDRCIEYTG